MSQPVSGRTVLITGAARGIGAEAAKLLAKRGARLALAGLEPEEMEKVAAACGNGASVHEVDVTDMDALERVAGDVREQHGEIYAVVANAGIAAGGMIHQMDPRAFERTVEVDLLGVWRTVHTTLPHVMEARGYVLNIASVAAIGHLPGFGAYSTAKAGVEAFSNVLRAEMRHHGVDVGCAYFSWIDTDMVRGRDENVAGKLLAQNLKGPMGKTYPLSHAAKAVALGVEKRCRIVVAPWWVRAFLPLRAVVQRAAEAQIGDLATEAERTLQQDIDARGAAAATGPVGAGGRADAEASGALEPSK
jgi:NAD(P)-dependent dehydrogenase (short-subunit alcohol dehydrogenase family)